MKSMRPALLFGMQRVDDLRCAIVDRQSRHVQDQVVAGRIVGIAMKMFGHESRPFAVDTLDLFQRLVSICFFRGPHVGRHAILKWRD
jgi:hypothetical protein